MTDVELLNKIQECADATAKNFQRPSRMSIIYKEPTVNGGEKVLVLGSDMPLLVYRVFEVDANGNVTENGDIQNAVESTRHYNLDIKPSLEAVPVAVTESAEYEIVVENQLENGAIEVALKSTAGRDIKMIEVYRYFDYVSKVFFVSCIATSFGGQYLFSVTPDSKHLRLIIGNDENLRKRVDMITELLQARLLPSYKSIHDAAALLNGGAKAHIKLNDGNGNETEFTSTFCYDDQETQTRYAFFAKDGDDKQGVILVCDIFDNNRLILSNEWSDEQKAAVDRFKALMKDNPDEFNKHACSFFVDDLDFRYNAFKSGKLQPRTNVAEPAKAEEAAEKPATSDLD